MDQNSYSENRKFDNELNTLFMTEMKFNKKKFYLLFVEWIFKKNNQICFEALQIGKTN